MTDQQADSLLVAVLNGNVKGRLTTAVEGSCICTAVQHSVPAGILPKRWLVGAVMTGHEEGYPDHYFAVALDTQKDELHIYDSLQKKKYPTEHDALYWYEGDEKRHRMHLHA
jgi:hypothetical protein